MKKYFFGYLFVKIAKLLAVFALLVGIGYCLWKYGQAHLAAESVAYRPSDLLQSQLARLTSVGRSTRNIVEAFVGKEAFPAMAEPTFPADISSNGDFETLTRELAKVDENRGQLKQAVVSRFDKLVAEIEEKLRERAAKLAAASVVPSTNPIAPTATPAPIATPPPPLSERETLYIENLGAAEIQNRTSSLERSKQLLVVLQTAAENPQNRRILEDAGTQLERLETLLPPIPEPIQSSTPEPTQTAPPGQAAPTPPPKTFNAEKVANELRANRFQVRAAILSSWEFDDAFTQASGTASLERSRCQISSIAVKGVWLAFFGQIGLAILATAVIAFLILVFADLTQTQLDTATNTGVTAAAHTSDKSPPGA